MRSDWIISVPKNAAEANALYHQAGRFDRDTAIAIGKFLVQIRDRLKDEHGWQQWVKDNLEFSYRKAMECIEVAEWDGRLSEIKRIAESGPGT